MNRLDIIDNKKKELEKEVEYKMTKLKKFKEQANNILLNEDTKDFFKLAYELYGEDIENQLRRATEKTDAERNNLIGKFDLLYQIIMPFYK